MEATISENPVAARHAALLRAAWQSVLRNPFRSGTLILCVSALICPFVTGIAVCEGIKSEYESVLVEGGDVYVTGDNYGSNAPVDLTVADEIARLNGVTKVVPRVIGRTYGRGKFIAVLGVDPKDIPRSLTIIEGKPPSDAGDVIMGVGLAKHLGISAGSTLHPENNSGEAFRVVGLFRARFTVWEADLAVMGFGDAARMFGIQGKATDLAVHTRPGYEQIVDAIVGSSHSARNGDRSTLRVQTGDLVKRYIQRGFNIKAGVFAWFHCVIFVLGIAAVSVISGFGAADRGREIGIMKAVGWRTQEVLEMVALENLVLALISAGVTILAAISWARFLNAKLLAEFFIPGLSIMAGFKVPWKILPVPLMLGFTATLILTMIGSIYSTWKTAAVPPSEALKG